MITPGSTKHLKVSIIFIIKGKGEGSSLLVTFFEEDILKINLTLILSIVC